MRGGGLGKPAGERHGAREGVRMGVVVRERSWEGEGCLSRRDKDK